MEETVLEHSPFLYRTEGIKYAGSKQKLIPKILELTKKHQPKTILDGFSGSTRVSQAFAKAGYTVFANDLSVWSEVFGRCYLLNEKKTEDYESLIDHLNHLQPVEGWFTEHYGGDPHDRVSTQTDGLKKPWQRHNTKKLDAIRTEIERLALPEIETAVLLTSLIRALDAVDNTMGHFASYLNGWSARSYKSLYLKVPDIFPQKKGHKVFRNDIFTILPDVEVDLAYFDPPYGSNNEKMPPSRVRYAAYYHLWTTVCLNDKPTIFGKAKRRSDSSDKTGASVFEQFRKNNSGRLMAVEAIGALISRVKAKHVILSYSSGGRATADELHEILSQNGNMIDFLKIDHKKNVMAGMRWTKEWIKETEEPNKEFLFVLEKK